MIDCTTKELELLKIIGDCAQRLNVPCYLVGGFVRDKLLQRTCKDLDFVCVGDGIALANEVAKRFDPLPQVSIFKTFGTANIKHGDFEIEFVGARKESYASHSRKPEVEPGTLEDDQKRRDFTINALAIGLHQDAFGKLVDPFGGLQAIQDKIIKTPLAPHQTFSDDPLRMLRAARFISQLDVTPEPALVEAVIAMADRLTIVSPERVRIEFDRLMTTTKPSKGLWFLFDTGLVDHFLPELSLMRLEQDPIHRHKDVLTHTLAVVENVQRDQPCDFRITRLAALFHDVGKPKTRAIKPGKGITFYHHEAVGARMTRERMRKLRYSVQDIETVAELVALSARFHTYQMGWTDAAVRRYVRDAGAHLAELNVLTKSDCTTRNEKKVAALARRMVELEQRIADLTAREELARFVARRKQEGGAPTDF